MTNATTTDAPLASSNAPIRNVLLTVIGLLSTALRGGMVAFLVAAIIGGGFALNGYESRRVLTGSMEPTITVGDLVISRPYAAGDLREGTVLNYRNGDISVTHRVVALNGDGTAVMQGDANDGPDVTPITEEDVLGIVFFVVKGSDVAVLIVGFAAMILLFGLLSGSEGLIMWSLRRAGRRRARRGL